MMPFLSGFRFGDDFVLEINQNQITSDKILKETHNSIIFYCDVLSEKENLKSFSHFFSHDSSRIKRKEKERGKKERNKASPYSTRHKLFIQRRANKFFLSSASSPSFCLLDIPLSNSIYFKKHF